MIPRCSPSQENPCRQHESVDILKWITASVRIIWLRVDCSVNIGKMDQLFLPPAHTSRQRKGGCRQILGVIQDLTSPYKNDGASYLYRLDQLQRSGDCFWMPKYFWPLT